MAEETKKMGFFKRILTSIKDFDKYQIFALENLGTAFKYFIKIMLIFTFIICATFTYKFSTYLNKGIQYVKEEIKQIEYTQGKLSINSDSPVILEDENSILQAVVIATTQDEEIQKEYLGKMEKYPNGIAFLKDKIVIRTEMVNTNTEYTYENIAKAYAIEDFSKEDVINFISNINYVTLYSAFFITIVLYFFMIYVTSTLIDILMLAVLGFIIARIAGMRIKFKATFNMGIYALTLPIILNIIYIVINNLTGFTIQYFQWMYTTISYIYMIVAILMIKTDLVNRQMEVMKIQEEQEKVREEIEQKKQEQEEEKKQENKEPNKEESKEEEAPTKKKRKQEKDNNVGEEPEGV